MHNSKPPEPLTQTPSHAIDFALEAAALPIGVHVRKRISSKTLLGSEREVEIEHGGQLYRLRLTALGKLILTK
ncbi:hemin uptake protein HemP [Roseateles oligotrophus]|uniref:Hemin uptake protein HemP n=1 Tax=Roseateles oligotrophus TaxID=1769250 RepID=A0ABT2Y8R7_9BURK|nr:hemin uptake protein HemP [Roseateles oligotrophus]MCV2366683.1 hemin uptake protein HemP [Roseateles oligotrophus]